MIDKPIKNGLAGSIHEKAEAVPAIPPTMAINGAMQQSEEAIAANKPVPIYVVFILFLIFDSYQSFQKIL